MKTKQPPLRLGVIGCGHWGPNHVRVFAEMDRSEVTVCADTCAAGLKRLANRHPTIRMTRDYETVLDDRSVDAVIIATPTHTHGTLTREALLAGKHVLVEKPLCTRVTEARELTALAERVNRVLMIGHVFLFNNGIIRLREAVESGALGEIHYMDAVRTNLGPVRGDVNALCDLGTHDISIFNYLLDEIPVAVAAHGICISQDTIEDVCFATLTYPDGVLGHIHVSWLNPQKVRTMTVVGRRRMAHWDDVDPTDTLRLHDKRMEEPPYYDSFGAFQYLLHSADVHMPRIDRVEPLINQANAFLDTVLDGKPCRSGGKEAEAIVAVLEAASHSLRSGGALCPVDSHSRRPAVTEPFSKPESLVRSAKHENAVVEPQTETHGGFDA